MVSQSNGNGTPFEVLKTAEAISPRISAEQACEEISRPKAKKHSRAKWHVEFEEAMSKAGAACAWDAEANVYSVHIGHAAKVLREEFEISVKTTSGMSDKQSANGFAIPLEGGRLLLGRYGTPTEEATWSINEKETPTIIVGPPGSDEKKEKTAFKSMARNVAKGHELFHVAGGIPMARLFHRGRPHVYPVATKEYVRLLTKQVEEKYDVIPSRTALQDALPLIEQDALDGPKRIVGTRIAALGENIAIDLGDETYRYIEVSREGWKLCDDTRVLFHRPDGATAFPEPVQVSDPATVIWELRPLFNVPDHEWPLVPAYILGAMNPKVDYPMGVLHGDSQTGKTHALKVIKSCVDPYRDHEGEEEAAIATKSVDDLYAQANNCWLMTHDNRSKISDAESDALCALCTGTAYVKRRLYSDNRVVRLALRRPVVMSTIHDILKRSDLRTRTLLLHFGTLDEMRAKQKLRRRFDEIWPQVFGSFLQCMVVALNKLEETVVQQDFRFGDWLQFVTAAEPALGYDAGTIAEAVTGNRRGSAESFLDNDFGRAIVELAADGWKGRPKELHEALQKKGVVVHENETALGIDLKSKVTEFRQIGVIAKKEGKNWMLEKA